MTATKVPVSVLVFTMNEEANLPSCLASLGWCDDVVVVDSHSSDRSTQIAEESGAAVYQNRFEGFGTQRNWALSNVPIKHDWILILDADERTPAELVREIDHVIAFSPEEVSAYRVKRRLFLWGRWLRYSGLYPSWVVRLFRKGHVEFANRGHSETQIISGETRELQHDLIDENLKSIDQWFERQNRYSRREAEYEMEYERQRARWGGLISEDPIERRQTLKRVAWRLPGRALLYFLYSYCWRRGFLEGKDGFVLCMMRALYQAMISVKKYDIRRRSRLS